MAQFFAFATLNQAIGINNTAVVFDTVGLSNGKGIVANKDGSTFTAAVAGVYAIDVNLVVFTPQDENVTGTIYVNGTLVPGSGFTLRIATPIQAVVPNSIVVRLQKGDTVVVNIQSTTGNAFLRTVRGASSSGSSIRFLLQKDK